MCVCVCVCVCGCVCVRKLANLGGKVKGGRDGGGHTVVKRQGARLITMADY